MTLDDCILWPGKLTSEGYVTFWEDGKPRLAHRALYQQRFGPIPDGMTVDHKCQERACLNPWHYQLVTRGENAALGPARATHCKNGHLKTEENFFTYTARGRKYHSGCRICRATSAKAWRNRQ